MKTKFFMFTFVSLVSVVVFLSGCATDPMAQCRQMMRNNPEMMRKETGNMPMMGQMQMDPEMMQQMMEHMKDNPMMVQCMTMMQAVMYPDSPSSLLAMKDSLKLSNEQVKRLKEIEESANAEARKILTEEQGKNFNALAGEWKPQSMMQGMQTMMPEMQKKMGGQMPCPCPMCQQMMQKK